MLDSSGFFIYVKLIDYFSLFFIVTGSYVPFCRDIMVQSFQGG